jgi:hypothetical protein
MDLIYNQPALLDRDNALRRQEAMRCAERWRLLHLAQGQRQSWAAHNIRRLLCWLGGWMVKVGRWLQEFGAPRTVFRGGA